MSRLTGVVTIAGGGHHSLALLSNGTVMAWGDGQDGQLGNGGEAASKVPVAVSGLSGVTAVAAGGAHSLAMLGNGSVVTWGNNDWRQLGDGNTTTSELPVSITGLTGVTSIATGVDHSMALLSNKTIRTWGAKGDGFGQLGNGSLAGSLVPVAVTGLVGEAVIAAGGYHSIASTQAPMIANLRAGRRWDERDRHRTRVCDRCNRDNGRLRLDAGQKRQLRLSDDLHRRGTGSSYRHSRPQGHRQQHPKLNAGG